jgi:hypothetical protein
MSTPISQSASASASQQQMLMTALTEHAQFSKCFEMETAQLGHKLQAFTNQMSYLAQALEVMRTTVIEQTAKSQKEIVGLRQEEEELFEKYKKANNTKKRKRTANSTPEEKLKPVVFTTPQVLVPFSPLNVFETADTSDTSDFGTGDTSDFGTIDTSQANYDLPDLPVGIDDSWFINTI